MKSKKEKTHAFNGHVKQNEYQPLLFDDFLLGFFGFVSLGAETPETGHL